MKSKRDQSRVELGRVSAETKGSVFGTIEQVGLYRPASISAR
jgi:hypothetical protein